LALDLDVDFDLDLDVDLDCSSMGYSSEGREGSGPEPSEGGSG
jgi:hypothetical protein